MITVVDSAGRKHPFEDASKVITDEHNNLCVFEGDPKGERMVRIFNRTDWTRTEIDYGPSAH